MSFPYIFSANFEAGTNAEWDSEADTGSKLDFPHYSLLATIPGMPAPYKGAYCMRVNLIPGDTNDHTVSEGDMNIADGGQGFFRFALYASPNFTATADDVFSIFELQQDGGTVEATLGMRITAATNALDIGIGDGVAPSSYVGFPRGKWVVIELELTVSTIDLGTFTLWMDGAQRIALTTLDHGAAVGLGVLGTQLTLSTTTGVLLFDDFIMDDARIYPPKERFPSVVRATKTRAIFVGPGWIEQAAILSANGTMSLYDTDAANALDLQSAIVELNASGPFTSIDTPTYFERGCYVVLGGTNPYGEVRLVRAGRERGIFGPVAYGGDGVIKSYGAARTPRPNNV